MLSKSLAVVSIVAMVISGLLGIGAYVRTKNALYQCREDLADVKTELTNAQAYIKKLQDTNKALEIWGTQGCISATVPTKNKRVVGYSITSPGFVGEAGGISFYEESGFSSPAVRGSVVCCGNAASYYGEGKATCGKNGVVCGGTGVK